MGLIMLRYMFTYARIYVLCTRNNSNPTKVSHLFVVNRGTFFMAETLKLLSQL